MEDIKEGILPGAPDGRALVSDLVSLVVMHFGQGGRTSCAPACSVGAKDENDRDGRRVLTLHLGYLKVSYPVAHCEGDAAGALFTRSGWRHEIDDWFLLYAETDDTPELWFSC